MCYPIDEAHDQLEVEMLGESLLLPGSAANNEVSDQGYVGGVTFGDFLCSDSGCFARATTLLSFCAVFSFGDVPFFFRDINPRHGSASYAAPRKRRLVRVIPRQYVGVAFFKPKKGIPYLSD